MILDASYEKFVLLARKVESRLLMDNSEHVRDQEKRMNLGIGLGLIRTDLKSSLIGAKMQLYPYFLVKHITIVFLAPLKQIIPGSNPWRRNSDLSCDILTTGCPLRASRRSNLNICLRPPSKPLPQDICIAVNVWLNTVQL